VTAFIASFLAITFSWKKNRPFATEKRGGGAFGQSKMALAGEPKWGSSLPFSAKNLLRVGSGGKDFRVEGESLLLLDQKIESTARRGYTSAIAERKGLGMGKGKGYSEGGGAWSSEEREDSLTFSSHR